MTKLSTRDSDNISAAIAADKSFTTNGSLQGEFMPSTYTVGQLSGEWLEKLNKSFPMGGVDWIIYSYHTPIAWRSWGQWIIPDTRYSVTTSKHQGTIRCAVR